jgi:hypothetical protein
MQTDGALTGAIDAAQTANSVSRMEWQVFNLVAERGPLAEADARALLGVLGNEYGIGAALVGLEAKRWVARDTANQWGLTDVGRPAHANIWPRKSLCGSRRRASLGRTMRPRSESYRC